MRKCYVKKRQKTYLCAHDGIIYIFLNEIYP